MDYIAIPFNALMRYCYQWTGNYVFAVIIFTLITRVILFPIAMWTQRNSIKMVEIMPAVNELKIRYFGDKNTIAEETQALYKRVHYHPLASFVPMFIQIFLLMAVISAVKAMIGDNTDTVFAQIPAQTGGVLLLMPLAAGAAALCLGLTQNRIGPLQREQERAEQIMTNAISVAISLSLGAFVSVITCVYWIVANLLAIPTQFLLNYVVKPSKYIDYQALNESREKLKEYNSISSNISKEDKKREKADYKKFFSVANKHLVFYSEQSGFYKYYQSTIEYLLAHSNVVIHYITSDPNDQIFRIAEKQPRIHPYYIGEKRLITLMMKMDAKIVVMTMPDLETYHIKRSYVRKDIEYVYVFHGLFTGMRTLRPGSLDHYDTLLMVNAAEEEEIRRLEQENNTPKKKLVPCGYSVVDDMARAYEAMKGSELLDGKNPQALIAPSWQPDNIVECCLRPLCDALIKQGYDVTVRPHPQYAKRFPMNFEKAQRECASLDQRRFRWETDFSSSESVLKADLLITDWSAIGYEYSLATRKPVLFINTPKKVVNPQCEEWYKDKPGFDMLVRDRMGISLMPEEVGEKAADAIARLKNEQDKYAQVIDDLRQNELYHFGEAGKYSALYLLNQLKN